MMAKRRVARRRGIRGAIALEYVLTVAAVALVALQ